MEELGKLSPTSRETSLEALPRKELQQLAKETGIKGNSKSKDIVQGLLAILDGTAEANTARADSDDLASSSIPTTGKKPASKVVDSASTVFAAEAQPGASQAEPDAAVSLEATAERRQDSLPAASSTAVSAEAADETKQLSLPTDPDAAVSVEATNEREQAPQPTEQDAALLPKTTAVTQQDPVSSVPDATVQIEPAAAAKASSLIQDPKEIEGAASIDLGQLESEQAARPETEATADANLAVDPVADASSAVEPFTDAANASRSHDSVSEAKVLDAAVDNPNQRHSPAKATSPAHQPSHLLQPTAAAAQEPDCISNPLYEERSASQLVEPESKCTAQQTAASASFQGPSAVAGQMMPAPAVPNSQSAASSHSQPSHAVTDTVTALDSAAVPEASLSTTDTATVPATTMVAISPTSTAVVPESGVQSVSAATPGQRGSREPTPDTVANLGKAVALVQARSCQLSPSLLTLQNSADMDSPAHDAFEKVMKEQAVTAGRKSGIWQGATEVELRQLERQWDDYKSVATRGWELPSLQDVQAKSNSLAASGFATVGSPILSKATREAMAKQVLSGKRKARSEEADAPAKRGSVTRKAVKRAAGLTPSRKGVAPLGTPLRAGSRAAGPGPSRLAMATNAADLENTGRAANASSTPLTQGKTSSFAGLPATPFSMGTSHKTAGGRGSKAIPKPRPANDRAKKAEATFAARRAAALAKGKK